MALSIVKSHLSVMSFKDLVRTEQVRNGQMTWRTKVVRLGHGFGDFPTLLKTLKEMNFKGPISFHSEYSGEPVDTVIDLARADVRYINGLLKGM